ncbi:MAG: nitroreductase [Terricaulis sp.]
MPLPASAIPAAPDENQALPTFRESAEALALVALRRSTKVVHLAPPGPDAEQLDALLRIAARVPDHGKLGPWRFIVIEGDGRDRAGSALASVAADAASAAIAQQAFLRAPLCVIVVSTAAPHPKIPEWEQQLSAGAACQNLLLGASAMGFGACWLTGWACYDARACTALGLHEHERIAGFIHIGTPTETPSERVRADWKQRASRF